MLRVCYNTYYQYKHRRGDDVSEQSPTVILHPYCLRCGRWLKNPVSMRRGYGEVCYGKIVREARQALDAQHARQKEGA
jgi:Family of unknown function (DUF6011)